MWNLRLRRNAPAEPEATPALNPAFSPERSTRSGGNSSTFLQEVQYSNEKELMEMVRSNHDELEKLEGESMALQESNKEREKVARSLQEEYRQLSSQHEIDYLEATETLKQSLEEQFNKNTDLLKNVLEGMRELKSSYSLRGSDLFLELRDDRDIQELKQKIEGMLTSGQEKINECNQLLTDMKTLKGESRRGHMEAPWQPFYGNRFPPPPPPSQTASGSRASNASSNAQVDSPDIKMGDLLSDYARLEKLIESKFNALATTLENFNSELGSLKRTTEANGANIEDLKVQVEAIAERMNQDIRRVLQAEVGIQVEVAQELVVPPAPIASTSHYLRSLLDSSEGSGNEAPMPSAGPMTAEKETRQVSVSEVGVQMEMEVERAKETSTLPGPVVSTRAIQSQSGYHCRTPFIEPPDSPPRTQMVTRLAKKRLAEGLKDRPPQIDFMTWVKN